MPPIRRKKLIRADSRDRRLLAFRALRKSRAAGGFLPVFHIASGAMHAIPAVKHVVFRATYAAGAASRARSTTRIAPVFGMRLWMGCSRLKTQEIFCRTKL